MRDVAGTAGVSVKTVSRVVNGERGVRADTAARVDAALVELPGRLTPHDHDRRADDRGERSDRPDRGVDRREHADDGDHCEQRSANR